MDHRPFEDWLLDNKVLSPGDKLLLNAHLQMCPSCTTLVEVNMALKMVKTAAPGTGFLERFQVRLALQKKILRRRNFWGFLLLALSAVGLFVTVFWPTLRDMIQSPVNVLASWFSALDSSWTALQAIFNAGVVLFRVVPGFVPAYVWMVILLAACGWSLVWIFSLMKFTKFPQGV
jgi:hypothetical protein